MTLSATKPQKMDTDFLCVSVTPGRDSDETDLSGLVHALTAVNYAGTAQQFDTVSIEDGLASARRHGIFALLGFWQELNAKTNAAVLSAIQRKEMRSELAKTTLLDRIHRDALAELANPLAELGVRALIVKGAALALSHYPLPGLRPRVDTDVLIATDDADKVHACLQQNGYAPLPSNFSATVLPERCYRKQISGAWVTLDLHWALSSRPILARALTFADLLNDSVSFDQSHFWRMPNPMHALLIAVVHRIGHHREQERYIWLYDVHLLWQAMSLETQKKCIARAQQLKLCALLQEALLSTQKIFATEISASQQQALTPTQEEASADLLQSHLSEFAFDWRNASVKERIALLTNRLWAQPEYLRQRFNAPRAPIMWLQLRRWLSF
jgi:hypothetical protein